MTAPRRHDPRWRDGTRNERQRRRQAALDEAAQAAGFETWSRLETAVINGMHITTSEKRDEMKPQHAARRIDEAKEYVDGRIQYGLPTGANTYAEAVARRAVDLAMLDLNLIPTDEDRAAAMAFVIEIVNAG